MGSSTGCHRPTLTCDTFSIRKSLIIASSAGCNGGTDVVPFFTIDCYSLLKKRNSFENRIPDMM